MRIFHKLLLLLLGIGLLPLLVLSLHDQRLTEDLGIELSALGRDAAARRMTDELSRTARLSATVMHREKLIVDLALKVQARAAEGRFTAPPPVDAMPAYFAEQFDSGPPPPGTRPSARHLRLVPGATEPEPMPVSEAHPAFLTAPGVERATVADDVARLGPLAATFASLHGDNPDLFLFQYVSLESGLHMVYPGHGGYPAGYDPRQRAWYSLARTVRAQVWTPPLIDASTRQLLLTASTPVFGPDGRVRGVTAIDVPVVRLLQRIRAAADLPDNVDSLLVQAARQPGGNRALRVLAHRDYQSADRRWDTMVEPVWLLPEDGGDHMEMLETIRTGGAGTLREPYRGADSLWAYAAIPDVNAALLMVVPFTEIARETARVEARARDLTLRQLGVAGIALTAVALLVALAAFLGARSVTRPARRLAAAARDVAGGDFERRVDIPGRDEFAELGNAFNEMVPQLKERMDIRQSLALAQEVQQHLLPKAAPDVPGLDIAGRLLYADETGGDYYDFLLPPDVPDGQVGIAVGDATGHGVPAALLMTTLRASLRSAPVDPDALGDVAGRLNRQLARDAQGGRFVTLAYMQIDGAARRARWFSAGHDPVLFYDPGTDAFTELDAPDIPLGIDPARGFTACARDGWPDGGILVLATDGVWEARDPDGAMFGKDRLRDVIRDHRLWTADNICGAVERALAEFQRGEPAHDDITLVVVRFTAGESPG